MKRNRNLTEIAAETRISRRYLEAIEADNVSDLPGEFFYKAFLRQYARVLGLDERMTQQVLSAAVPVSEPDPVPALNLVYEKAHSGDSVRWRPSTGVAVGVLVAVLAGGSALFALWQRVQAREEQAALAPAQEVPPVTSPAGAAAAQAPVAVEPGPGEAVRARETPTPSDTVPRELSATAPIPAAAAPPAASPLASVAEGQVAVQLTASEPAWVQVWSDGKTVFLGTLEANQPRVIPIGSSGKLLTGNAGAVDVRVNGKTVGALGPKGQVRTVLFTGGSAEVVAPKPRQAQEDEQLFSRPQSPAP